MTAAVTNLPQLSVHGGEMSDCIRAFAWERTPLGPLLDWPENLKTFVRLLLAAPKPMMIWWGEAQTTLYNDAARAVLGPKHPDALGASAPKSWRDEWSVLTGVTGAPRHIVIDRDGARSHYSI